MTLSLFSQTLLDVLQCPRCHSRFFQRSETLQCEACDFASAILSSNFVSVLRKDAAQAQSILKWPREAIGSIEAELLASTGSSNGKPLSSDAPHKLRSFGLLSSAGALTPLGALLRYNSLEYEWQKKYDVLEGALSLSQLGPAPRILDIGCGSGQTLRLLNIPDGAISIGIDDDLDALAYGSVLAHGSAPNLFCGASAHNLPIRDQSFDLVICRGPINYCNQTECLKEAIRVLRPGGWLFCRVEQIWWDLNMLRAHGKSAGLLRDQNSVLSSLFALRNLGWGLLHELTGWQPTPGGVFRGSRAFTSQRRIRRIVEPLGCRLVLFEDSRHGPQYRGHGTQAKVLCRREDDAANARPAESQSAARGMAVHAGG